MQTDNSYCKIPPIKLHVHFIISVLKTYYFKQRFGRIRNTIIRKIIFPYSVFITFSDVSYRSQISQKQDERLYYAPIKHLYYALCLACWAFFGLLVQAMCNRTSCAQVHESPQSHCGDNREDTLFSWLHIYLRSSCFCEFWVLCVSWITYDHLYTIKLFPSLIKCSISCTIEQFNWIVVRIQLSLKYSVFHINYFTIFSLITTLWTEVTKSLQCKGIFLSNATWRHAWR